MVDKVTLPLYPHYLPTRPEGFTPTIDIPQFDIVEPGSRANPDKPEIFTSKANITKITPRCGTEIRGVQISSLSKNGLDQVALLAAERGVLVFRDQDFADIGTDRQRDLVSHYGPLHQHPTMGYPEGSGPEFHVVYADEKVLSFFWVLESPASGGGDTAFTSLTSAYKALSPAFQRTLHSLSLLHTSASVGEVSRIGLERALKEAVKATHPLIISHPVTKEPVLFINPTIARSVEGFLPSESDHLLSFLHDHIRSLDFSCRVRWEPGSVVVWDQRTVAHSAVPDFVEGERRHMVRMIPYGSVPQPAFPSAN